MTDSAISGPIPSPGKSVALIGVGAEEKALAADANKVWLGLGFVAKEERIWLERLRSCEAIVSLIFLMVEERRRRNVKTQNN